jgi:hypothetical protein
MHGHVGTFAKLIRLAPRDVHDDALAMPRDVIDFERHEFRASECSSEAHEQERSITHAEQSRRQRFDHRTKIRRRERCLRSRSRASTRSNPRKNITHRGIV